METRGRALYNLISMNWQEDTSLPVFDWQVENYRSLPTEELFESLDELEISLDEEALRIYADAVISPEELADTLWVDEDLTQFDQAYLLIFELWRRLLPEKASLSIFCDELDHLISQYDQEQLEDEEEIHQALSDLESILDEHVDQGADPKEIFAEIGLYCSHDLESFVYDFASDQIDADDDLYASEILDAFEPYLSDHKRSDFLQMRLIAQTDQEEADTILSDILDEQKENPDLELLLDIARFLVHHGAIARFVETITQTRALIETEQDFQELMAITSHFYQLLDREEKSQKVLAILKRRLEIPLEREIASSDRDVEAFFQLVEDLDRSEA